MANTSVGCMRIYLQLHLGQHVYIYTLSLNLSLSIYLIVLASRLSTVSGLQVYIVTAQLQILIDLVR